MKTYSVSLCLSIEAETEQKAIAKFCERTHQGDFGRNSIDIELEKIVGDDNES